MADTPMTDAIFSTPSPIIPQKRPSDITEPIETVRPVKLKEKNTPREPREKKESWKKKESSNVPSPIGTTSSGKHTPGGEWPTLIRWRLPPPQEQDYYGHRAPPMAPCGIPELENEFFSVNDHPMNRRGFRYTPCEATRMLPTVSYRNTEYAPYAPRINFEDMNGAVHVNRLGTSSTTLKGWRMARANVGVREGDWYYECKIVRGIPSGGHVRVGWARREAPLGAPVGFDGYSYGIRDMSGQRVHMSRPKDFADVSFEEGDVIGLRICLPPLETQRGLTDDLVVKAGDVIRDRIPIRFKNQLWFEQFEYQSTKDMEELMNPSPGGKPGNPPKTLPGSWIKVYRNGEYLGTPWEDLYAFLPPASRPSAAIGGRELDDGTLGYYPAVSVFRSAIVEVNFGPEWICPLKRGGGGEGDDSEGVLRPLCERYDEQIAEDITYDIVDEVGLLFSGVPDVGDAGAASGGVAVAGGGVGGGVVKEEIKEMVMEDE